MTGPIGIPVTTVRIDGCSACGADHAGVAVVRDGFLGGQDQRFLAICPDTDVLIEVVFLAEPTVTP